MSSSAANNLAASDGDRAPVADAAAAPRPATSVITRLVFDLPAERVWEALLFYEQIDRRPPWHLRLLLPVPIRTEGSKSAVGDEAMCLYEGGHLVKRVTHVERRRQYLFDVVEQALRVGGGLKLSGGGYTLRELQADRTEVTVDTRYVSPKRPRWLWRPVEAWVCHMFHRHILRAMRRHAMASAGDASTTGTRA